MLYNLFFKYCDLHSEPRQKLLTCLIQGDILPSRHHARHQLLVLQDNDGDDGGVSLLRHRRALHLLAGAHQEASLQVSAV